MSKQNRLRRGILLGAVIATSTSLLAPTRTFAAEIRVKGSDTMVQLATAWAEAYRKVKKDVLVNANGGGTGTGMAALQNDITDICNASREIKKAYEQTFQFLKSHIQDLVKAVLGEKTNRTDLS